MKILYALQGTGNGHVARALEIVPILNNRGQVDLVVSGDESQVHLPFEVMKHYRGITFKMNKTGGISLWKSLLHFRLFAFLRDVWTCPVKDYDLVIVDFEPVVAWACVLRGVKSVGMSHQLAVLAPKAPKAAEGRFLGTAILKYYAPTYDQVGFHFRKYNKRIYGPVIRSEVREMQPRKRGFYLVYLPAYSLEHLRTYFGAFPDIRWKIFTRHTTQKIEEGNVKAYSIDQEKFLKALKNCSGVICGAGFELPSEALYLQKKLMVVPIKGQYEQACNALSLQELGVPVLPELNPKSVATVQTWIDNKQEVTIDFSDKTSFIIDRVIIRNCLQSQLV
jgi:uncharacterized protein (TIGR00661 family)